MSDKSEIKRRLEERASAIGRKDARATVAYYSHDVVNFDIAPPLAQRASEATDPAELQGWFNSWNGPIAIEFGQLEIHAAGDLALAYGFVHMKGQRTDGSETDIWTRFTAGLERRSGEWMIVHEHQSFPMRMDGSETAATDLHP